jgi:alkyl hydroperoxide reductase subunit AhpF
MAYIGPEDTAELKSLFAGLTRPVTLHLATEDLELRLLVDELAATSEQVSVDKLEQPAFGLTATPGIALTSESARGHLLFYGLPVGYEMATIVSTIVDLGSSESLVAPATQQALDQLPQDVHIQVFSTPT